MITEKGKLLIDFVKLSGRPFMFEPSVKLLPGYLLEDRFLVTIAKQELIIYFGDESNALKKVLELLNILRTPLQTITACEHYWPQTELIHLGSEIDHTTGLELIKIYFEFTQLGQEHVEHQLIHKSFKWYSEEKVIITDYILHQTRSAERASKLICKEIPCNISTSINELLQNVCKLSKNKTFMMLKIVEKNQNKRLSYDMNLYNSHASIGSQEKLMNAVFSSFSIPLSATTDFIERHKAKHIGHIAAGKDRKNRPFMTLYYGAEGFQ